MLITPHEAASRLGVHVRTVWRLLNTGRLVGVRLGRAWRVRVDDEGLPVTGPPRRTEAEA